MRRVLVVSVVVLISAMPLSSYARSENDEGGIVGTGNAPELDRPEIMQHPEVPDRIERPDVEQYERPDLSELPSAGEDNRPPAVEPATPGSSQ